MCPCGRPLHYVDPRAEARVRRMVREAGPTILISMNGGVGWLVPRHYIALHGLKASELDQLGRRYHWGRPPV